MNSVGLSPGRLTQSKPAPKRRLAPLREFFTARREALGLSLVLLMVTMALYSPVIHHPFANIDDMGYVYENLHVQEGLTWPTLKWAITTFDDDNWHPLTWVSHSLDCQMFGIDPAGHHIMNAAWHTANVLVLFWVLLFATGCIGRSFMVAALFAFHPINVESVAWMAERKTLLGTFFFLLALGAYGWYARRPRFGRYCVVALLFALGLMAKPQIITLPFVLLLWDYWPLQRMFAPNSNLADRSRRQVPPRKFFWLIAEKIPLLVISAASALITMMAQHVGRMQYWPFSIKLRMGNAIVAYVRYIGKTLWPSHLSIMYLHPGYSLRLWQVAAAAAVLLAITGAVLIGWRHRYLPVGWFWFLGTLVPTIGLVQVGRQALADRYAYQSFLGLFLLICWGVADCVRQRRLPKALLPAASVAVLAALMVVTRRQINVWKDNLTLWTHAMQVTKDNWMAEDMVAGILFNTGHREEAMAHYRAAAAINPDDAGSNIAVALYEQEHGNLQEAIRHYQRALTELDDPLEQAKAYHNMAIAYRDMGDIPHSVEAYAKYKKLRGLR